MIMWRCDRCGHYKQMDQIVGKEFEYVGEFMSLAVPIGKYRDLCKSCMGIAQKASTQAMLDQHAHMRKQVEEALK